MSVIGEYGAKHHGWGENDSHYITIAYWDFTTDVYQKLVLRQMQASINYYANAAS